LQTVLPFDIDAYIAAPWYVQAQQPVFYQPENTLYCVRAIYQRNPDSSAELIVDNYANENRVNGPRMGSGLTFLTAVIPDAAFLKAVLPDASVPSKLSVGPSFLPTASYGPYWVIAAGTYKDLGFPARNDGTPMPKVHKTEGMVWWIHNDNQSADGASLSLNKTAALYDWAIISGGQPTESTPNGCRTTDGDGFSLAGGLWLFTRDLVAGQEAVDRMKDIVKDLGLDVTVLKKVEQKGCNYDD